MTARFAYKRVVVGIDHCAPDRETVRAAAELAGLMRLDLMGLFIADPGLLGLAGRPGAREFQVLAKRWQPLSAEGLSRDIELSALSARRAIDAAARASGVRARFETVQAAVREAIRAASQSSDIVIVAEPHNPVDRAIAPFPQLVRAAVESAATVLFLPRRLVRSRGPVLAIATSAADPGIAVAAAIASAAGEGLVVIEAFERTTAEAGEGPDPASEAGVSVGRLTVARSALADIRALSSALGGVGERMIVVTRGAFGEADGAHPADLASLCGVPVLMVEPAGDSDTAP